MLFSWYSESLEKDEVNLAIKKKGGPWLFWNGSCAEQENLKIEILTDIYWGTIDLLFDRFVEYPVSPPIPSVLFSYCPVLSPPIPILPSLVNSSSLSSMKSSTTLISCS